MGWWEQLTGSEQRYKARRDADRAAASAASAQEDAIAKGRDIMQKYYMGGGEGAGNWINGATNEITEGANRAENLINQGADSTTNFLGNQYEIANQQVTGARDRGLAIARQYYDPFRESAVQALGAGSALNKLTGVQKADPGEIEALTQGSPMYQWREKQAQDALMRAQRARGISDSRFAVGESGRLNAQLSAEEQDRRIAQLMGIYQQGLGTSGVNAQFAGDLAGIETGAGSKMADLQTQGAGAQANVQTGRYQNLANLETDTSAKRAGLYQDLGDSIAASYGAQGAARASSFATAAQNAMAGYNQPSPLQQAVSIFSAAKGGGKWW